MVFLGSSWEFRSSWLCILIWCPCHTRNIPRSLHSSGSLLLLIELGIAHSIHLITHGPHLCHCHISEHRVDSLHHVNLRLDLGITHIVNLAHRILQLVCRDVANVWHTLSEHFYSWLKVKNYYYLRCQKHNNIFNTLRLYENSWRGNIRFYIIWRALQKWG